MVKQYFVRYESDKVVCGSNDHPAGAASSLKSAKAVIRSIRKNYAEQNPRNFRVYDTWAELDPATNHTPIIYSEN